MLRSLKLLIWTYIVLLIAEGALRKWVLPGLADPLLIIRDPVLLAIYVLAIIRGDFPANAWTAVLAGLTAASVAVSLLGGLLHPLVIAYGIRINYLHLPLIWIMAKVLTRRDVEHIGTFFLLCAIPMTVVMVEQFRSPMDAWINKGVGLSEGGQIFGAEGRIRPPGFFAFITGPQIFFPFCAAFLLDQASGRSHLKWPLLLLSGGCILIALPVSISRTAMLATGIVGLTFLLTLPYQRTQISRFLKPLLLVVLLGVAVAQLPIFDEGVATFSSRWTTAAASSDGDGWQDVLLRTLSTFTNPLVYVWQADLIGQGIGVGSNVGARLLAGQRGFFLGEEEHLKILGELGLVVGGAFILFRVVLAVHLGLVAWRALGTRQDPLPLLLIAALANLIIFGQWAPPTVLGFTVVGSGLLLACLNVPTAVAPAGTAPSGPRPTDPGPAARAEPPRPSDRRPAFASRPRPGGVPLP